MKRTIIDICAMTSFVIVVMLGASALNVYLTRESRIKENRDWMIDVIEKEVIKQIKFMMPKESGGVIK
tara:strand:- start:26 stop:229 length:204 start_codon:yes stop_codon:yes gene_type:complete